MQPRAGVYAFMSLDVKDYSITPRRNRSMAAV